MLQSSISLRYKYKGRRINICFETTMFSKSGNLNLILFEVHKTNMFTGFAVSTLCRVCMSDTSSACTGRSCKYIESYENKERERRNEVRYHPRSLHDILKDFKFNLHFVVTKQGCTATTNILFSVTRVICVYHVIPNI